MKPKDGTIVRVVDKPRHTNSDFAGRVGKVVNGAIRNDGYSGIEVKFLDEDNRPWYFSDWQYEELEDITELYNSPLWKALNED